jgi:hypothetical protein
LASKTKGGLLLAAVVVGGLILGGQTAIDTVTGWLNGGGTSLIGEGETQLMVASSAESKAKQCGSSNLTGDPSPKGDYTASRAVLVGGL